MNRGLFITFEGPDAAGKTTQIRKVAAYLNEKNRPYLLTREPGGTRISEMIRAIILDPEHKEMADETEVLLYAASRAQHVRETIVPALEQGKIVLCDRFVDASVAYQGYGLGVDIEKVLEINRFATGGLMPDRSYFIDISPEEAQKRMLSRSGESIDRIEQKQRGYHDRVRQGFRRLYENDRTRIRMIDGHRSVETIFAFIRDDLEHVLFFQTGQKGG